MTSLDQQYNRIFKRILEEGKYTKDRTGVGSYSIFGASVRHNMDLGFPLITTRKMWFKGIWYELFWMMGLHLNDEKYEEFGFDNIKFLVDNDIHIWNDWLLKKYQEEKSSEMTMEYFIDNIKYNDVFAKKYGYLGRIYGTQWRSMRGVDDGMNLVYVDQLKDLIKGLRENPDSRRHKICAWNPVDFKHNFAILPCCHHDMTFTSKLNEDGTRTLNLAFTMRSSDFFVAGNWNFAFYAILLKLVSVLTNHKAGELLYTGIDCHVYDSHLPAVRLQLMHEGKANYPTLFVDDTIRELEDIQIGTVKLLNYQSDVAIKVDIAV